MKSPREQIKSVLLHCGLDREELDSICPMIWQRNIHTLRITAWLSLGMGLGFLLMNYLLRSGIWLPYLFLAWGSAITLALRSLLLHGKRKSTVGQSRLLCYGQMILVCAYAGILSTQPSNYDVPATSVIVFIALLPLTIDDRPIRMYAAMVFESLVYLSVSHFSKAPKAFSLDIINTATFCVVGMILYSVICIRNVRELHQSGRVERIQRNIISSLANVVEERDESTGDHILRTEGYVEKLIERMKQQPEYAQLTKEYCGNVILAAPMHDIGKIKIPDSILNKPGRLTAEEYAVIQKHAFYGAEIISRTLGQVEEKEYCDIAYNIARHHHERYDGTGYPDGLKGEEIPLEARIMALADVYDALVSERVYKKALPGEEARKIMEEGSGTQFDPKLVPLFLACVKESYE